MSALAEYGFVKPYANWRKQYLTAKVKNDRFEENIAFNQCRYIEEEFLRLTKENDSPLRDEFIDVHEYTYLLPEGEEVEIEEDIDYRTLRELLVQISIEQEGGGVK